MSLSGCKVIVLEDYYDEDDRLVVETDEELIVLEVADEWFWVRRLDDDGEEFYVPQGFVEILPDSDEENDEHEEEDTTEYRKTPGRGVVIEDYNHVYEDGSKVNVVTGEELIVWGQNYEYLLVTRPSESKDDGFYVLMDCVLELQDEENLQDLTEIPPPITSQIAKSPEPYLAEQPTTKKTQPLSTSQDETNKKPYLAKQPTSKETQPQSASQEETNKKPYLAKQPTSKETQLHSTSQGDKKPEPHLAKQPTSKETPEPYLAKHPTSKDTPEPNRRSIAPKFLGVRKLALALENKLPFKNPWEVHKRDNIPQNSQKLQQATHGDNPKTSTKPEEVRNVHDAAVQSTSKIQNQDLPKKSPNIKPIVNSPVKTEPLKVKHEKDASKDTEETWMPKNFESLKKHLFDMYPSISNDDFRQKLMTLLKEELVDFVMAYFQQLDEDRDKKRHTPTKQKSVDMLSSNEYDVHDDLPHPAALVKERGTYEGIKWADISQIKETGVLLKLTIKQKTVQELKFKIITSEAYHLMALNVLQVVYSNNLQKHLMWKVMEKNDHDKLFKHLPSVMECSTQFLNQLNNFWQRRCMLEGIFPLVSKFAKNHFSIYYEFGKAIPEIIAHLQQMKNNKPNFAELVTVLARRETVVKKTLDELLQRSAMRINEIITYLQEILENLDPGHEYDMCEEAISSLKTYCVDSNVWTAIVNNGSPKDVKADLSVDFGPLEKDLTFPSNLKRLESIPERRILKKADVKSPTKEKLFIVMLTDYIILAKINDSKSSTKYTVMDYCQNSTVNCNDSGNGDMKIVMNKSAHFKKEYLVTFSSVPNCDNWVKFFNSQKS